jgi:uracil-DNA glycosylase
VVLDGQAAAEEGAGEMTVTTAKIDDLMLRSKGVVRTLASDPALRPYVDAELALPRPFLGTGEIHLVIIGQDPTVENKATRKKVTTVLMLDGKGHLSRFLSSVGERLDYSLENVYATNVCKNFFKETPTQIKAETGIDVIGLSNPRWLPLLQEELSWFPNAAVLALGEPVLQSLVRTGYSQDVKTYWGYQREWSRKRFESFKPVVAEQSVIDRMFFPFVHLNTNRKGRSGAFYVARFNDYLDFIRDQIREETHAWQS